MYIRFVDMRKPITEAAPQIYDCLQLGDFPNLYVFPLYAREFGFLIKDRCLVLCTHLGLVIHFIYEFSLFFFRM